MKDSTNAKGIFNFIFQKRHIFASADTLNLLSCIKTIHFSREKKNVSLPTGPNRFAINPEGTVMD